MSEAKDFYVKKMGHEYDRIENASWYLADIASRGAVEISNHLIRQENNFSHVGELTEILTKYQPKDGDTFVTAPRFPYLAVWEAVRKDSDKEVRRISDLALEMRLLAAELGDIPQNPENSEKLMHVLVDLSREFLSDQQKKICRYRLVA